MYVIIAGCRKVGSSLAMELAQENHDVVVIDSDPGFIGSSLFVGGSPNAGYLDFSDFEELLAPARFFDSATTARTL